jgi:hypothetical protein
MELDLRWDALFCGTFVRALCGERHLHSLEDRTLSQSLKKGSALQDESHYTTDLIDRRVNRVLFIGKACHLDYLAQIDALLSQAFLFSTSRSCEHRQSDRCKVYLLGIVAGWPFSCSRHQRTRG